MKIEYSSGDADLIAGGILALRAVGFRVRLELVGQWTIIPNGGTEPEPEEVTFASPTVAEVLDDNRLEVLFYGVVSIAVAPAVLAAAHVATIVVMPQESKIRQPLLVTH